MNEKKKQAKRRQEEEDATEESDEEHEEDEGDDKELETTNTDEVNGAFFCATTERANFQMWAVPKTILTQVETSSAEIMTPSAKLIRKVPFLSKQGSRHTTFNDLHVLAQGPVYYLLRSIFASKPCTKPLLDLWKYSSTLHQVSWESLSDHDQLIENLEDTALTLVEKLHNVLPLSKRTMMIHLSSHFARQISFYGPVNLTWAYPLERAVGALVDVLHCKATVETHFTLIIERALRAKLLSPEMHSHIHNDFYRSNNNPFPAAYLDKYGKTQFQRGDADSIRKWFNEYPSGAYVSSQRAPIFNALHSIETVYAQRIKLKFPSTTQAARLGDNYGVDVKGYPLGWSDARDRKRGSHLYGRSW